jgi:hypothetical protein
MADRRERRPTRRRVMGSEEFQRLMNQAMSEHDAAVQRAQADLRQEIQRLIEARTGERAVLGEPRRREVRKSVPRPVR